MKEYYFYHPRKEIYAIYYAKYKELYINLDFEGTTKLYYLIW